MLYAAEKTEIRWWPSYEDAADVLETKTALHIAHRMRRLGDQRLIHHEGKCQDKLDNERCLYPATLAAVVPQEGRHDAGQANEATTNAQDVSSSTRPRTAQDGTDQRVHV